MDPISTITLFGLLVMATHLLEGITGFGCTVLALPFAAMLLGLQTAVPVLGVLAWLLALYIVFSSRKHIEWRVFLFIAIHCAAGLPIGMLIFDYLPEYGLKAILTFFMLFVGGRGFVKTCKNSSPGNTPNNKNSIWMRLILLFGGIIHGAFASGGPLVVIYAGRALTNKALFRVTLCLLWSTLNTILIVKWSIAGNVWNSEVLKTIATALPFLVGGTILGDILHRRVDERIFRLTVYAVLFLSGLAMGYENMPFLLRELL